MEAEEIQQLVVVAKAALERAKRAPEDPYEFDDSIGEDGDGCSLSNQTGDLIYTHAVEMSDVYFADGLGEFIASARTDVPDLASGILALCSQLKWAEKCIAILEKNYKEALEELYDAGLRKRPHKLFDEQETTCSTCVGR